MKKKGIKKVIALVLCLAMCISATPLYAFASIPNWADTNVVYTGETFGTDGYYNVISKKDYTLVPGAAVESEMVLNNAAGTRRQVIHVIEVDPSNPDVSIVPGYNQIDKDLTNEANWSHKELTEMAKYYENNLGYNIVGGMNTDLYYNTYAPRVLVYNGVSLGGFDSVKVSEDTAKAGQTAPDGLLNPTSSILYVFKDAEGNISCDVKAFNDTEFKNYLEGGTLLHAVGVSFGMVVKDGELVSKTVARGTDDAARSMVGVKEDGTLVLCMNDGRGANNSVGFSSYEEGEAMLALGCKWAANCDGGGSSTFLTKRVGEDTFTMRSTPCDGAQRPTAHGIFVTSNVAPTGELDVVNVEAAYDYFAPKTEYTFEAEAIDTHGYAMDMPADATWALSDDSFGTIANGKFVSSGKTGTLDVQVLSGGKVVGSKTITVADPAVFKLSATSTVMPYSTADKVRTITVPIVAMIGESNVYVDTNAVKVTLSDSKAGTLEGFKFTATTDTSVVGTNITVTYGDTELTYAVEFGKGSEVIFDFEDGDKAGFMGFEEAKKWSKNNGVNNSLVGTDPLAGQFNEYLSSKTFVANTANGGQVRNGKNALAWKLDNTDAAFASWSYNVLFNTGETIVLRDVANDMKATTLGMWVYIPEGAPGLAFQSQLYVKNADGTYSCKQDHFMFTSAATGKATNLNSATEADIPESRWVYASIDISKYDYLCTPVATDESNSRSPSFIRTYVKPTAPAELTFYIDDITLDYSSAVDDRELPTISNPTYATADTAVALENGTTVNGNKVAFATTVSDNAALDVSTGKIYIDGVEMAASVAGNTLSSKEDAVLKAGVHTVTFEIKDELGNPAKLTRTFTVAGDAAITLTGHNESGEAIKAQSIYYVDLKAADLASITKLTTQLKLNNANKWETEGAVVADGFKATYDYNEVSELLTVTVEVVDATKVKADAETLVSIPVRVWTFDRYNYVNDTYYDAASMGNKPVVNVDCEVAYGEVTFDNRATYPFGGAFNVETELVTITSPYHVHDEELTTLSKEPTSTQPGYEGRTYCETCKSVVDWGTVLEPLGHNYEIVDGKFVCADEGCGDIYQSGTGIFEMNGDLYYSIAGTLMKGWQYLDEGTCFANTVTYKLAVGKATVNGITYDFGENGITEGAWFEDENGTKFSYGPDYYRCGAGNPHANVVWVEIGDKTYAFDRQGYRHEGIRLLVESNNPGKVYEFTDEGVLVGEYETDHTGIFQCDGMITYLENGTPVAAGLVKEGNDYYYINSGYIAVTGTYNVTRPNGLLPAGTYEFGEDGKMINVPDLDNGPQDDGYFYINGVRQSCYQLVEYEGHYYFINDGHKIAKDKRIYLSERFTNGTPFTPGYYEFDADGKLITKNGPQDDGYFYINGVRQSCYQLVEYEGDYYFINDSHKIAKDRRIYLSERFTSGTPFTPGYYEFDADGKLIIKNGPQDDGYFYINGVRQSCYQLVEFEGEYYFINDSHKIAKDRRIYLSERFTNGTPFTPGYYEFDADGKLIIKNGPQDDGYFYINGVRQSCYQLVEYEGHYYFINDSHKIAKDKRIYLSERFTSGTPFTPGYYEFDADGKLITKNGPQDDGYFYINGVRQSCYQLIKYNGDYYFINDGHKYAVNKKIHLGERFVGDTYLKPGYYEFDAEGKMIGHKYSIYNGRDIGDVPFMTTTDGKDIKSGLLIRGGELDNVELQLPEAQRNEAIEALKNVYGIKTEIDLRAESIGGKDVFGKEVVHNYYNMVLYEEVFTAEGKEKVKAVFTELANPDNYPIYMHCTYGADRAGTISYILEVALGVSESNALREYLLSVGSYGNAILEVRDGLKAYGGATIKECAELYLLDCGLTQEQIDSLREIYLAD